LSIERPIPFTFSKSSIDRNRPRCIRSARMALARLAPTPGRRRRSSKVAELSDTGSPGEAGERGGDADEDAELSVGAGKGSALGAMGAATAETVGAVALALEEEGADGGAVPMPPAAVRPTSARRRRPPATPMVRAAGFA
jgi:hypothetical protein